MFGKEYLADRPRIENSCTWLNHAYRIDWGEAVHSLTRTRELSPFYLNLWCAPDIQAPKRHVTRFQQVTAVEAISAEIERLGQRVLKMESTIDEAVSNIDASLVRLRATQAEIDKIKEGIQVG